MHLQALDGWSCLFSDNFIKYMNEVTKNKISQHIFAFFFVKKDFLEKTILQQMNVCAKKMKLAILITY